MTLYRTSLLIGGEWREASDGARFAVLSPQTGSAFTDVADASVDDARRVIDAAWEARSWRNSTPRERAEILQRAHGLMIARKEDLAALMVAESGKTITDARTEVDYAAEFFRWFSEEASRIEGSTRIAPNGLHRIVVEYEPIGIAVLITPWNFPAAMVTRKIAPAIVAGCTAILKPAAETPLTALAIAAVLEEAGTPPGVVNILPTSRTVEVGSTLLGDPRVRKISFTGSTEVGKLLLRQAAESVLSCSMELGGNAPFIVLHDADIDEAVAGAVIAKTRNTGQACTAANRFFIHRSLKDAFVARFTDALASLRLGDPTEGDTNLGPLIDMRAVDEIDGLVRDAADRGARIVLGGHRPNSPGSFYPATVLDDVPGDARILKEEIFGPVAPIVAFDDEEAVVAEANATPFGLVSYVYSGDIARARRIGKAMESGMVAINRGLVAEPAAPFGGTKQSGLGREGATLGLHAFLEPKYYSMPIES